MAQIDGLYLGAMKKSVLTGEKVRLLRSYVIKGLLKVIFKITFQYRNRTN